MSEKVVGLSLSSCVREIVEGKVYLEDVAFIIAGTKMKDDADFVHVLDRYSQYYLWGWDYNPLEARRIATKLWKSGRVTQPRVTGGTAPNPSNGCWLNLPVAGEIALLCPSCRKHWAAVVHPCINNYQEFCISCDGCAQFCAEFPMQCTIWEV
jgi:hypothetical protein